MGKNYYKILGVRRGADLKKIKQAYRTAAKRYHPDVSPRDEERFKELQEAYETLSDPVRRGNYDRTLTRKRAKTVVHDSSMSSWDDHPQTMFGGLGRFFTDPWGSLFGIESLGRQTPVLEVILSPEEAEWGGELPLEIPFLGLCSRCYGSGGAGGLICGQCRGRGTESITKRILLTIPAGVHDRTERRIHVDLPGLGRIDFVVMIRIRNPHPQKNSGNCPCFNS